MRIHKVRQSHWKSYGEKADYQHPLNLAFFPRSLLAWSFCRRLRLAISRTFLRRFSSSELQYSSCGLTWILQVMSSAVERTVGFSKPRVIELIHCWFQSKSADRSTLKYFWLVDTSRGVFCKWYKVLFKCLLWDMWRTLRLDLLISICHLLSKSQRSDRSSFNFGQSSEKVMV